MSTSEGLSTGRSGDSRSHHWHLIVDVNVAYHLTHNAGKSWKIQEKVRAPGFEPWWVASHWTILPLDYKTNRKNTPSLTEFIANSPNVHAYIFSLFNFILRVNYASYKGKKMLKHSSSFVLLRNYVGIRLGCSYMKTCR
jgi:hypothetical protein